MGSWTNATPAELGDAGVLRRSETERHVRIDRHAPAAELLTWVESYWLVGWDLPQGTTFESHVLTQPSVHVTVEWGDGPRHGHQLPATLVHGVVSRRFSVTLRRSGRVFGVKFRPGGFAAFTGAESAVLTDRVVPFADLGRPDAVAQWQAVTVSAGSDAERVAAADRFLLAGLPAHDERYADVLAVVAAMVEDPSLTTVEQVARRCGATPRTLQRLFRRYVGIGPKWMLRRVRLLDAAGRVEAGEVTDWPRLARELGWYDQAHFIRDFAQAVGMPPSAYAQSLTRGAAETR